MAVLLIFLPGVGYLLGYSIAGMGDVSTTWQHAGGAAGALMFLIALLGD